VVPAVYSVPTPPHALLTTPYVAGIAQTERRVLCHVASPLKEEWHMSLHAPSEFGTNDRGLGRHWGGGTRWLRRHQRSLIAWKQLSGLPGLAG
jgi:hypothetical protein